MNFLNRALTHTKVACTWDEPEQDNKRYEVLFRDDMENKIDLDDYLAPGIDEGYDPDEDEGVDNGPEMDMGVDSGASSDQDEDDGEEEEEETHPVKKLKIQNKFQPAAPVIKSNKNSVFSDFDKKNRKGKAGGIKITFKNPLEKGVDVEDNPLGKRVYSMKFEKKSKHPADEEDGQHDFFTGEAGENDFDDGYNDTPKISEKDKLKNMKFKDRLKEKKKQAKLEKEKQREEKKTLRELKFNKENEQAAGLSLVAGEEKHFGEFRPDFNDTRFEDRFTEHDLAVDPTSIYFKKDKHSQALRMKKQRHNNDDDY